MSDDSEDEMEVEFNLSAMQKYVMENPRDYDKHVQLINACRSMGELKKLRAARKHMSQVL